METLAERIKKVWEQADRVEHGLYTVTGCDNLIEMIRIFVDGTPYHLIEVMGKDNATKDIDIRSPTCIHLSLFRKHKHLSNLYNVFPKTHHQFLFENDTKSAHEKYQQLVFEYSDF